MKKTVILFSTLLPFLLLQQHLFAQDDNDKSEKKKYDFVKTKTVTRSYNVSSADKLDVKNSFGSVEVHTWARNEIKVDVSVEASSNSEGQAQKIIDGITISDSRTGNEISFKTTIKGSNNNGGGKSSMKVNYSISMPASNPLSISNEFGATILPDYRGEVELVSKFGSLTTGDLLDVKSVNVEFGKARIGSVANGMVSIKYSKAEIGRIVGKGNLSLEFSTVTRINIDHTLTSLDARVNYSTVNFKPVGELPGSYDISTSFGSFKNRTSIKFETDEANDDKGPKFDHNYNGRSGNGSIPIKVKVSFGKLILGEPGPDDLKEKENKKSGTS